MCKCACTFCRCVYVRWCVCVHVRVRDVHTYDRLICLRLKEPISILDAREEEEDEEGAEDVRTEEEVEEEADECACCCSVTWSTSSCSPPSLKSPNVFA